MLRGIEFSYARFGHLQLDHRKLTVTLHLPVSKTEWAALGCHRTHGCCCKRNTDSDTSDSSLCNICPYHSAVRHLHLLKSLGYDTTDESPLMPNTMGTTMTAAQCRDTVKQLVATCGGTLPIETPSSDVGQHILRVAGAQMFARARVPLSTIQLLGRWGSEAVKRHVQEADL